MSKEFTLFDQTITFTDKQIARAKIIQRFGYYADAAAEITKIAYLNKINSYKDLIADNGSIIQIVVNMFFEPTMKFIVENKIYDFSDKDLLSKFNQYNSISEDMEELLKPFDEILQANASAQQYREFRKESRGRVIGGGFGFEGAVKGMAAAGAMNAAAGIGHSIFNSIGNALDNANAQDAMNKIFKDENLIREYVEISSDAILTITMIVLELFEKKNLIAPGSETCDGDDALFENLKKGRIPDQEVPQIFIGLIQKDPYSLMIYDWGHDKFPEYKDSFMEMVRLMCYVPSELSSSIKKVEDLTGFDKFVLDRVKELLGVDYVAQLTAVGHENADSSPASQPKGETLVLNEKEKKAAEQKKEKENSLDMGSLCGLAWVLLILAGISAWLFDPGVQAFELITGSSWHSETFTLRGISEKIVMLIMFLTACGSVLIALGVVGNCLAKMSNPRHPTIKRFTGGSVGTAIFTVAPILISLQFEVMKFREKTAYVLLAFVGLTVLATLCGILQLIVFKSKGISGDEVENDPPAGEEIIEESADIENKDSVDVILVDCGARKMDVLKAVRSIANLGLAEARAVVDKSNSLVKANVPKANAEIIKKDLQSLGAKVVLR
ncbi:MAG: ribosomal protein L7/L12 [Fibrobacter sp.]|nr:ribosomal protein L7/L12 [Fibrobacter sp.]